jgi:MtN3 and saliva related transmembrane protein
MLTSIEQILGLSAGGLTCIASLPQLIKIIKEKQAKDVSLKTLIILLIGISLWITYGILKKDTPIIVTNGLAFALNIALLVLRIIYGGKEA